MLFVLNLWSIGFLEKVWVLLSCSFVPNFQKTKTYMIKSIFNKVGSCCFTIYKFHCWCFNVESFWNFDTSMPENIFCFLSHFPWKVSNRCSFSFVYLRILIFIPCGFNLHFQKKNIYIYIYIHYIIIIIAYSFVVFSYYYIYIQIYLLNHTRLNPWSVEENYGNKGKTSNVAVNNFWILRFTVETNNSKRCNLNDVESLEGSHVLSRSRQAKSMPVF